MGLLKVKSYQELILKIGIIEICVEGHYVVVNALIKTYLSSTENEVLVFTTPAIKKLLAAQNNHPQLSFVVLEDKKKVGAFIQSMNAYQLNRIHYSTISKYFKEFYLLNVHSSCEEYFHFHNIDLWFMSAFKLQAIRLMELFKTQKGFLNLFNHFKYSVKDILWDYYRKKLITKLIHKQVTFIILSEAQKKYLESFLKGSDTLIFPSLIFEDDSILTAEILPKPPGKIRVCVPGAVVQSKKEYDKFLTVLEKDLEFYKQYYIFDLLGRVSAEEKNLFERIKALEKNGLEIYYYLSFIDVIEFDQKLYASDIILSNMHLNDGLTIQNKETAAVYQMIRGAKPGIFPGYFQLDHYFEGSVIKFATYDTLDNLFKSLVEDKDLLINLQVHAKKVSQDFTPENLLKRLIP